LTFNSRKAQTSVAKTIAQAAEVMEHPADLINVAIEELVKERFYRFSTILITTQTNK
jgi:hypothetical protein